MFLNKMRASSDDRSAYGDFWFQPTPTRTGAGLSVTADGALQLPVVLACVRVLAESFSILPLKVYKKSKNGRELLKKHWLYDLFSRRPNDYQTSYEWREMLSGHLAMRGNCYNRIITDKSGNIKALMPMHPDRITIEMISESDYRYRYKDRLGKETVLSRADVWHVRGLSSDGIVGLSPISLAAGAIGMGLAAQEYGARFFQNDAKPGGGWIEFPGNFKDKAAREQFRESFQEAQGGVNRHKTTVLELGMKYHEIGMSNTDSQFLEARQFQVSDIARIFRIPPHLVGDLSKATFSNIEQQSLDFIIQTMTPWAERWESSIECDLLLDDEKNIEVEFDFVNLLRGDQAARAIYYHNGILDGWMTRNEARQSENLAVIDGLDEPLMPLNMIEAKNADKQFEQQNQNTKPVNPQQEPKDARLVALIEGNARRMAKRIAKGDPPTAIVLAAALAIDPRLASDLLATELRDEDDIFALLMGTA